MTDKVKVSSIVIQFPDGTTKKMSIQDAMALHDELTGLFGSPTPTPIHIPVYIERDRGHWCGHWWTPHWSSDDYIPPNPRVWCRADEVTDD